MLRVMIFLFNRRRTQTLADLFAGRPGRQKSRQSLCD